MQSTPLFHIFFGGGVGGLGRGMKKQLTTQMVRFGARNNFEFGFEYYRGYGKKRGGILL